MDRIFSLRLGRIRGLRPSRPRVGGRPLLRVLSVLLLLSLALLLFFNFRLYPDVCALALAEAKNEASALVAASFSEKMSASGDSYTDLVTLHFLSDGGISGMSCNMPALNAARNALLSALLTSLGSTRTLTVTVPLGNVIGGELFSGRGPGVPIRILLARTASAHMESEFSSAGINQTLHRILFTVTLTLTVLTPTRPTEITLTERFCLAETVIVGKVPDAFTQINRLTDSITEQDIDDIFDFGAEVTE